MKKLYFAIVALLLCAISANAKTIYLDPWQWTSDGANFAVWAWPTNGSGKSYSMKKMADDTKRLSTTSQNLYSVEIPDSYNNIIFLRLNKTNTTNYNGGGWPNDVWNQTGDLKNVTKNFYVANDWMGGDWKDLETTAAPVFGEPVFYYNNNNEIVYDLAVDYNGTLVCGDALEGVAEAKTFSAYAWESGKLNSVSVSYTVQSVPVTRGSIYVNDTEIQEGALTLTLSAEGLIFGNQEIVEPATRSTATFNKKFQYAVLGEELAEVYSITYDWNDADVAAQTHDFVTNQEQQDDYIALKQDGTITSIGGIEVENAPVEYFNLQGVRVANPENGLFIRRQGNKVEKVVIK